VVEVVETVVVEVDVEVRWTWSGAYWAKVF
jgi:hypothetical protein